MSTPLPRIPEPELMDEIEQARAYAQADFSTAHDRCVERFVSSWPAARGPVRGLCLDIGCGPADVVVRMARACPALIIDGVDGSEAMLGFGRERVAAAGLGDRVRLHKALLPDDPLPRPAYDVVTSNSILHHLHDPQVLWRSVRRAARPGAHVFIMDLRRPATVEQAQGLIDLHARGEPEVLRRDFYASLLAAFTPEEVRAQLAAARLPFAVEAVGEYHLTITGTFPG